MRRAIWLVPLVVLLAGAIYLTLPKQSGNLAASVVYTAPVADLGGYARATEARPFVFPADHGPHEDYQTEWWYYTGNLISEAGEHFGYQLTFFRRAIVPPAQRRQRASDWATDQVFMAHLALTDVNGNRHVSFEKLARGAAGIAGAQAAPFGIWLDDWSVTAETTTGTGERMDPAKLRASMGDIAIELTLNDLKGPVLEGDRGYSPKGPEPGNASYYYSLPRIESNGTIKAGGRTYEVKGLSWMDHEFSTAGLGRDVRGWDWFSIQLDNNTELMLYQFRKSDGRPNAFSSGTLVAADGTAMPLGPGDFSVQPVGIWHSPRSGADYPSGWEIQVPSAGLELTVVPYLSDQEMEGSYVYWEGAVKATGASGKERVSGDGYVELTGYAGSMQGRM